MAPITETLHSLLPRYCRYGSDVYGNCYRRNSTWNNWGRWVALVVIIFVVLLLAIGCSCINARRRRKQGLNPRYGTGWLGGKPGVYNNQPQYYNNAQQGGPAAPPYSPPPQNYQNTGNTFNSNEGYYGQQSGIELQQPNNIYQPQRGGQNVYEAPQGPPPGKGGY